MTSTAKLFMHGRTQAVQLPREFRFEGTEVRVSKVGDKVILEPIKPPPSDAEARFARLDELGGGDFLPEGIPDDRPYDSPYRRAGPTTRRRSGNAQRQGIRARARVDRDGLGDVTRNAFALLRVRAHRDRPHRIAFAQ